MKGYGNPLLVRVAAAVPEQRRELGLSVTQLAHVARVSRSTIGKIERGGHVRPELLLRIASALMTLELYQGPRESAEGAVDDLVLLPLFPWPPASPAAAPTLGDVA